MIDYSVRQDRLDAVLRLDGDGFTALLDTNPLLAAALLPAGPLPRTGSYAFRRPTTEDADRTADGVARLIATHSGTALTIGALDQIAYQLVLQARWHGGMVTREEALAEIPVAPDVLDRAAQTLANALISDPALGWVVLRPGVAEVVPLPGVALISRSKAITTERVASALRLYGVEAPPRKPERIEALRDALADPTALARALSALSPAAKDLFELLVARCTDPPHQVPLAAIGITYFNSYASQRTAALEAFRELYSALLVGVEDYDQSTWVWLETLVARRGGLSPHWPPEPSVTPAPIDRAGAGPTRPLLAMEALLDTWTAAPPAVLKNGGIPVRALRALTKPLGVQEHAAVSIVQLALELMLLERHTTGVSGRGRNRVEDQVWRPSVQRALWSSLPSGSRWAMLVQAWLDGPETGSYGQVDLVECAARYLVVHTLLGLPEGTGLPLAELTELLRWRHHALMRIDLAAQVLDDLRTLGMVPAEGPVGLVDAARRLLGGDSSAVASHEAGWIIQPDHTVIVDPGVEVDALSRLGRLANLESDAGVRVYRLDPARVAAALANGEDADGILGFLAAGARVPLPDMVEHLVRDAARRPGGLTIGPAGTWLTCEDPVLLAKALAVKTAKLTRIAPTTAVSPLAENKVSAALQAKGLVLTAAAPPVTTTKRMAAAPPPPVAAPYDVRTLLVSTPAMVATLRDELVHSARPEVREELARTRKATDDARLARMRQELELRRATMRTLPGEDLEYVSFDGDDLDDW